MCVTNHRLDTLGWALLVLATGACSDNGRIENSDVVQQPGFDGVATLRLTNLADPCVIDSVTGSMTLIVEANETAYVYIRGLDGLVSTNALVPNGSCAVATTKRIIIRSHDVNAPDDQKVILDFSSGTFGLATKATVAGDATSGPNILVDLGKGIGDSVKVMGTSGVDTVTLGSDSTASYVSWQAAPAVKRTFPDIRIAGAEDIVISTGAGDDVITGQAGAAVGTTLTPLDGSIRLTVYGGDGNDTITSGAASTGGAVNALYGGPGDDKFIQQVAKAADDIHGEEGIDLLDYSSRSAPLTVIVGVGSGDDGEAGEGDTVAADVENITGGSGKDFIDASAMTLASHILIGGAGDDTLIGSDMADHLYGGEGNDTLKGGGGDDVLEGGDGDDVLQGGQGNDTIKGGGLNCPVTTPATCVAATSAKIGLNTVDYADHTLAVFISLADLFSSPMGQSGENDVLTDIRNIRGGSGNDGLTGDGNDNTIWGGDGNDTIHGGGGNDALYGEAGDDQLYGEAGNDYLCGGAGSDTLYGGDGNDFLDADDGEKDAVIDCGNGDADIAIRNGGTSDVADPTSVACEM
jgi:Ca2+-binding RTX toxin-like protein